MIATTRHTIEDLYEKCASDEGYELIEGELIPVSPTSFDHGVIQATLATQLRNYVQSHGLGKVVAEVGFIFARNPDTVLAPDVAFVQTERLPTSTSGFADLPPDLAVEITSPSNSPGEIERKLAVYLKSGVRALWVVYPEQREIVTHSASGPPNVLTKQDSIEGGEVLPGLSMPVSEIFD